ncbi:excitatory amino acid transporter 1-like [Mya arenaria]|uniref:excitatory amino acid transporter 1-like n=1 Tax=Mya arenaria TaxID=6604 RepID=UPI0022E92970|nr:excitatory amino acid transporter 1-like [Mya arenaria]XP_052785058.1 excitatory amino acid transporter 1-like [Mya arenaria]XP_052785059.1 excitatory amino acid transporter 1-like [Mya arenaria]XP_052785060.1 excitatory amino acid transporter 1-like [Mya arenaria]
MIEMKGTNICCSGTFGRCLKREALLLITLVAVGLGFGIGFAVRTVGPSDTALMWMGLPGQLYLRALRLMIVPLIICSVIVGTASLDAKQNGKITIVSFIYIFVTNMIATILGILGWLVFQPGKGGVGLTSNKKVEENKIETHDIFADLIRNIFPSNLFEATFQQDQTNYQKEMNTVSPDSNTTVVTITNQLGKTGGANLLGLIFVCIVVGIAASALKEKGKPFILFFDSASAIVTKVIRWFMWLTPIGVLSLILATVASLDDVGAVFRELSLFIGAVVVALVVQQGVVLPLILFLTTRNNPLVHLQKIGRPWIIAFSTASSAISTPEMIYSCEHLLKIDSRITRFVISFCLTLSANGSALFIACSCLFIWNLTGEEPTAGDVITFGLLVTVSSLAIPSVPSASIVTIVMLLDSLSIPGEATALLFGLEFLLDRLRSTSSVSSNTICAAVTAHFCEVPRNSSANNIEIIISVEEKENMIDRSEESTVAKL